MKLLEFHYHFKPFWSLDKRTHRKNQKIYYRVQSISHILVKKAFFDTSSYELDIHQ